MEHDLENEIQERIDKVEVQLEAGKEVIAQCRKQIAVLKRKLKEYKHLKTQVEHHYHSTSDGDL